MRIIIAQPVEPDGLRRVRELVPGAEVEIVEPFGPEHRVSATQAAHCSVLFSDVPPANVADMTALRWIQLGSHGYAQFNGITLPAAVTVCNASGVNDIPIAEWCVLMMLSFARDLPRMLERQRAHRWDRDVRFQAELRGGRVGILGYGNIGQEVARRARALGLQVWVQSRFRPGSRDLRYHPFDDEPIVPDRVFAAEQRGEFFAGLDYLVITVPVTATTRGLVDRQALAALPRHAVLLNPARAGVVDEQALLDALREGSIGGAALDDHYRQPMPADDPFWDLPNTVISAHVSGSTGSTYYRERIWNLFARNLQRHLTGEPLLNRIADDDLELGGRPTA